MIGSETFIIVAFKCTENSTSRSSASATCSRRNASSARRLIRAPSTISPASTGMLRFRTVTVPSVATCSIRSSSSARIVTEVSEWKKSPSVMVDTWLLDLVDQAPMECGWALANALTDAGARRSELPSRRTGFTALPFTAS
jgi:hypothetical protein